MSQQEEVTLCTNNGQREGGKNKLQATYIQSVPGDRQCFKAMQVGWDVGAQS